MKSLLLSVLALIAVGSVSTTLVSCDDDDKDTTIYQQWKMSEADFEELVDDHSQLILHSKTKSLSWFTRQKTENGTL